MIERKSKPGPKPVAKPKHEALAVHCPQCEGPEIVEVDGEYAQVGDGDPFLYRLGHCTKCSAALLLVQEPDYPNDLTRPERLYPQPDDRLSSEVPIHIRRALGEAITCMNSKAFSAVAIMCRRTVELTVADLLDKKTLPNLRSALEDLYAAGLIEARIYEWSSEVKGLGNKGAHSQAVRRTEAQDALDFAEAIVNYVYVYKARFDRYRKRNPREANGSTRSGSFEVRQSEGRFQIYLVVPDQVVVIDQTYAKKVDVRRLCLEIKSSVSDAPIQYL